MSYKERTLKFHEMYRTKLMPIFATYESERKVELARFLFCMFFAVFCYVVPSLPLIFPRLLIDNGSNSVWTIIPLFSVVFWIIGVLVMFWCKDIPKNFSMKLKQCCLPHILKLFDDIKWKNNAYVIGNIKLNNSGLFGDFNRRQTDDEFVGSFKDVSFKICETAMQYESGSGKNRTCISVFKGVVISFKSNKTIKNRTIIATKGDLTKKNSYLLLYISLIGIGFDLFLKSMNIVAVLVIVAIAALIIYFVSKNQEGEPLNEVTLEDPRFCKKFNAYSSDQVEARYLLTTAFIERFQNLNTAFGAKKAKCSFFDDEIMFAISTNKNLFEIGSLFKSLNDPTSINAFYDELSSIYDMVTYFKLDEKIGL